MVIKTNITFTRHSPLYYLGKAKNRMLPDNMQNYFIFRSENQEDHRRKFNFKHPYAQTTIKQMCIVIACGVKLWNSLTIDLKVITTIHQYKNMHKHKIIRKYEADR